MIISADADDIETNDSKRNIIAVSFPMSGLSISQIYICDNRNEKLLDEIAGYDVLILAGGHVPTQNRILLRNSRRKHSTENPGQAIPLPPPRKKFPPVPGKKEPWYTALHFLITSKSREHLPLPGLSLPPCASPAGICSKPVSKNGAVSYWVQPSVSDRFRRRCLTNKVFRGTGNTL